ncbi:HTH-type transcriptional repressor YtrA [Rosistilla carotiformis]|uniref:HTH-type transcriptional repressor YtrA n=1 Tax=Rosistilla carotiformis TaxID=2528017 RepID=A0A518JW24_9BACT|nr:GntR family transcriptional regulator [Rosistilla carotiformis]QDV69746.1 HTH-type transcriptional repressor YtrA [Rosistilla carotiformis]
MQLHITTDGVPIFQQIVDQVRYRIVSGQLIAGAELPTIRGMAEALRVNPNTVARAYRELEHEGLVEKRRTTGTFVAEQVERRTISQRRGLLQPHLERLIIQSRQLGFSIDEVVEQLKKRDDQIPRDENRS